MRRLDSFTPAEILRMHVASIQNGSTIQGQDEKIRLLNDEITRLQIQVRILLALHCQHNEGVWLLTPEMEAQVKALKIEGKAISGGGNLYRIVTTEDQTDCSLAIRRKI